MFALLLANTVVEKKKRTSVNLIFHKIFPPARYLHALSVLAWFLGVFRWLAAGEREAGEERYHGDEEEDELHFLVNCFVWKRDSGHW